MGKICLQFVTWGGQLVREVKDEEKGKYYNNSSVSSNDTSDSRSKLCCF